jgi:hypothetical protein
MVARTPLVIISGQLQQLPAGDTLNVARSDYNSRNDVNGEAATAIVIGAPCYMNAAGSVRRAQANALATSRVTGVALSTTTVAGAVLELVTDGLMTATTGQWDAVTGETGGLVFDTIYYLDPTTPGRLTATAPSTVGQTVVAVGVALSTTELSVNIQPPILL